MSEDAARAGLREVLSAKRAELEAELAALSAPVADQSGIGFGKRVGEGTSLAVERLSQVAAHGRLQVLEAEVRRALTKLDEGTYGVCDTCAAPIAEPRLEARPWATRCLSCSAAG